MLANVFHYGQALFEGFKGATEDSLIYKVSSATKFLQVGYRCHWCAHCIIVHVRFPYQEWWCLYICRQTAMALARSSAMGFAWSIFLLEGPTNLAFELQKSLSMSYALHLLVRWVGKPCTIFDFESISQQNMLQYIICILYIHYIAQVDSDWPLCFLGVQ